MDDIAKLIKLGRHGIGLPPEVLTERLLKLRSNESEPNAPHRANYCRLCDALGHTEDDHCQTCGMPPDTPGYLKPTLEPTNAGLERLIPCPDCHSDKVSEQAKVATQLSGWLRRATFDNYGVTEDNRAAYEAAKAFAEKPTAFLTLWGEYGPGKTHLLAAITNALGGKAKYFTMPDLVSQYRSSVGSGEVEDFYDRVSQICVLVIDEIDKACFKDWTREQIYRLFDYRYREMERLGTVLALNENPGQFNDNFNYLFSRMKDERCKVVEVGGGDNRPNVGLMGELAKAQK